MPTTQNGDHEPPWWLYVVIFVPLLPVAIWAAMYRPIGFLALAACAVPLIFSVALLMRQVRRRKRTTTESGISE